MITPEGAKIMRQTIAIAADFGVAIYPDDFVFYDNGWLEVAGWMTPDGSPMASSEWIAWVHTNTLEETQK